MKKIFTFLISLSVLLTVCLPVLAKDPPTGLQGAAGRLEVINSEVYDSNAKPIQEVVGGIISGALTLLGVVFLILTVYGGYVWLLASGDESEVTRAQGILKTAVIGLIIVTMAYAITYYVVDNLNSADSV